MRVYYLTGAQFAISNIALRRIKISRYRDLNDPFELLGANLVNRTYRRALQKTKEEIDSTQGIICFSKRWKNPLLWGHYAEKHTGIALGFDVPDECLTSMLYRETLEKITLDPATGKPSENFVERLLRVKFRDWKYEEEVRLTLELDHRSVESGMFFEPFSGKLQLKEVILGPKCEIPISSVRELVEGDTPKVFVVKSRIAFSKFGVVENRSAAGSKT